MESGTHAMEVITALIDGPLCFLVAFGAIHEFGWRHPLQIILCTMQLYGLVWFTLQPIFSESGLAGHFSSDPVSTFIPFTRISTLTLILLYRIHHRLFSGLLPWVAMLHGESSL